MKNSANIIFPVLLLALGACRDPLPCTDCEVSDDEPNEELPPADLPCSGADLQNDDFNCGVCGVECQLSWPDTVYEAGHCAMGECGPRWVESSFPTPPPDPPAVSCDDICGDFSVVCVERGCAGKTGYTCGTTFGQGCAISSGDLAADFIGPCSEPVPWPPFDPGTMPIIGCCCAVSGG